MSRQRSRLRRLSLHLIRSRSTISLGALAVATIVMTQSMPTSYDIQAATEIVSVRLQTALPPSWWIPRASMYQESREGSEMVEGEFQPRKDIEVVFERIAFGPLRILCRSLNPEGSVGSFLKNDAEEPLRLGRRVVFRIDDLVESTKAGKTIVMPIIGQFDLGQSISSANVSSPLLRGGKIRLLGSSWVGSSYFDAGSVDLAVGDKVHIDKPRGLGSGIVVVNETAGLTAVLRIVGTSATVSRFGATGYKVGVSLLERLKGDGGVQAIWIAYLSLLGLFRWFQKS